VGQNILKVFKYLDGTLKALSPLLGKRDPAGALSQAWVPGDAASEGRERLLVGMQDGEVLLLEVGGQDVRVVWWLDRICWSFALFLHRYGLLLNGCCLATECVELPAPHTPHRYLTAHRTAPTSRPPSPQTMGCL
jgi:hypothetical protein